MSDEITISTKEICPIMAEVTNALIEAGIGFDDSKVAVAVAALGVAMIEEKGLLPAP